MYSYSKVTGANVRPRVSGDDPKSALINIWAYFMKIQHLLTRNMLINLIYNNIA